MRPAVLLSLALSLLLHAPSAWAAPPRPARPATAKPVASPVDAVLAAAPFALPPQELLALHGPKLPAGSHVEVLLDDTSYRFDAEGKRISEYHMVYRVLSDAAVEHWASVAANYQPWFQAKPTVKARVVTPDGQAHTLDPKTIVDELAESDTPNTYSDRRTVSAPLPAVRAGSVVETLVMVPEHKVYFAAGALDRHTIYVNTYTALARVSVSAPESLRLSHAVAGTQTKPAIKRERGVQTVTLLERDQLPFRKWPATSDPERAFAPTLDFATGKSWSDVAEAYGRAVDAQLASFDAKSLAADIVGTETDREAKLHKLLAYLHREVRYTGLELGERSILPAAPSDILQRRYGDCKDKATVLVGLLRASGFEAHVALLRTGPWHDVPSALPGMGMFNHAIVHVGGSEPRFIDATAEHAGPRDLPYMDQDRLALIARRGTSKLVRTPRTRASESVQQEEVQISYGELGKATIRERNVGSGTLEAEARAQFDRSDEQLAEQVKAYVKDRYGATLTRAHAEATREPTRDFELTIEANEARTYESFDDGAFALVTGNGLYTHLPSTLYDTPKDKRSKEEEEADVPDPRHQEAPELPVYISRAHTTRVIYRLSVADGYRWHTLPDPIVQEVEGIHLSRRAERQDDRNIQVTFELSTDTRMVPAAALEKVRSALHDFDEQSGANIRFVHSAREAVDQGQLEAALRIHRDLVAKYPKSVYVQSRYAQDLLRAGLGLAARRLAEQLAKQHPESARAHWTLGYVHVFDEAGRDSYPGADFVRAEKALRAALAKDPDDELHYKALAVVLSSLAFDRRPVNEKQLDEAIGLYEKLRTRFKDHENDQELLRLYAWRGRHRELSRVAEEMEATDERNGLWVASVAASEGATAAQRKAEQLSGGDARSLLGKAASVLALMSKYQAAYDISQLPSLRPHVAHLARSFDQARRRTECEAKLAPAAKTVVDWTRSYLLDFARLSRAAEELEALPEHTIDAYSLSQALAEAKRSMASLNRAVVRLALPVAADTFACGARYEVEEKAGAVRVKLHALGAAVGSEPSIYYLRKTKQGYALIAYHNKGRTAGFSRAMLLALGEKKLDEARAWAEWAWPEVQPHGGHSQRYQFADGAKALWPRDVSTASADELELLAAYLAGNSGKDGRELKVLEAAAKRKDLSKDKLRAINAARARDYWKPDSANRGSQLLGELHREFPEDKDLWERYIRSLYDARQQDSLRSELDTYDQKHPDNAFTSPLRNAMDRRGGRYAEVVQRTQSRLDAHKASAGELNNVAWDALFAGGDLTRAVTLAEAACEPESEADAHALHTLATLYAETGNLSKAQVKLLAAMHKRNADTIGGHEWYTWGRIAEGAGLTDMAREAYSRVKKPEFSTETDTYELAQRRLRQLGR